MSQLNPNAAEFVPVSPTRSIPSPACRALINDEVISQSPKRPSAMNIKVPNESEFTKEVKSRPSEVEGYSNGHGSDSDHNTTPTEIMENLLNGKSIEEIPEFQPGSTPTKTPAEEFHFGPNAAPFTPVKLADQSEAALSTKAVFGDETTDTLNTSFNESSVASQDVTADLKLLNKESDPMSMSFYADKGESNPFDLNAVQVLPDNLDEFLNKADDTMNDTISDLPEHDPFDKPIADNDEAIQITDLDKPSQDDEKELASPLEPEKDIEESKSPQPTNENLLGDYLDQDVCQRPDTVSPRPESVSPMTDLVTSLPTSPLPEEDMLHSKSPVGSRPESKSEVDDLLKAPSPACRLPKLISPDVDDLLEATPVCGIPESKSPVCDLPLSKSPVCNLPEAKTECDILESKSPVSDLKMEVCSLPQQGNDMFDMYLGKQEIESTREYNFGLKENLESPHEDVTSSVKDDKSSPVQDLLSPAVKSPEPINEDSVEEQPTMLAASLNFAQELSNAMQEAVPDESCQLPQEPLVDTSTPKSVTDTESVATTDVNSFLERSQIPDVASPLSNSAQQFEDMQKCFYQPSESVPTQEKVPNILDLNAASEHIDVRTEHIVPEFAEQAVVTPGEESKQEDVPAAPLVEGLVQEPIEDTVKVEEVAEIIAAAAAVPAVLAAADVTPVKEEKAPFKRSAAAVGRRPAAGAVKAAPGAKPAAKSAAAAPKPASRLNVTGKPAAAKTSSAKPITAPPARSTAPKPSPKPKTTSTTTAAAAKPLTNGDVKKTTITKRAVTETATKTTTRPATASAARTSLTKPASGRPATAPKAPAPRAAAAAPRTTTAAPKPRPNTLTSRTTATTPKTGNTLTVTKSSTTPATRTSMSPRTAPASSPRTKPFTSTALTKPRVPPTRTVTKTAADTEKQNKDSANKLTASRTVTSTRTTGTASARTSTLRKTETKTSANRTTVLKTTTTTMKSATSKKPTEITRNVATKTKTTKIEKPKENGVSTVVTEEITVVNNVVNDVESQLLKDNSPIDNKLIVDNTLIQTNTAD